MIEFTKERIERLQWMVTNDVESKSAYVALVVLDEIVNQADEIERLQQRVQELETKLKSKEIVIENKQKTINRFVEKLIELGTIPIEDKLRSKNE